MSDEEWDDWEPVNPYALASVPIEEALSAAIQAACAAFCADDGKDPEAASLPYAQYLRTDHWRAIRHQKILRSGYHCACCYRRGRLEVHHLSYKRLGREYESDLIVLCGKCHELAHVAMKRWDNWQAVGQYELLKDMRRLLRDDSP